MLKKYLKNCTTVQCVAVIPLHSSWFHTAVSLHITLTITFLQLSYCALCVNVFSYS